MPTGRRTRSACQECHTWGRFRPLEVMYRRRGAWEWRSRVLCAVCRVVLEHWAGVSAKPPLSTARTAPAENAVPE